MERASQIVFFILPWRHDFLLAPLRHPRGTDFGQQMDIEFIRKDHHRIRLPLLRMPPNPGQSLDALGVVIFRPQLGPFPHPAHLMEPAPDGPRRHFQAMLGLELGSQRGTAPPRAAPAIGPWWGLEECPQRAPDPGHQDGGPDWRPQLALCVDGEAQLPGAIEAHNPVDTRARAEQEGRDVGRITASGAE